MYLTEHGKDDGRSVESFDCPSYAPGLWLQGKASTLRTSERLPPRFSCWWIGGMAETAIIVMVDGQRCLMMINYG